MHHQYSYRTPQRSQVSRMVPDSMTSLQFPYKRPLEQTRGRVRVDHVDLEDLGHMAREKGWREILTNRQQRVVQGEDLALGAFSSAT